jgi:hypothetical protein
MLWLVVDDQLDPMLVQHGKGIEQAVQQCAKVENRPDNHGVHLMYADAGEQSGQSGQPYPTFDGANDTINVGGGYRPATSGGGIPQGIQTIIDLFGSISGADIDAYFHNSDYHGNALYQQNDLARR